MVPKPGFEPGRGCPQRCLRPSRLPVPPLRPGWAAMVPRSGWVPRAGIYGVVAIRAAGAHPVLVDGQLRPDRDRPRRPGRAFRGMESCATTSTCGRQFVRCSCRRGSSRRSSPPSGTTPAAPTRFICCRSRSARRWRSIRRTVGSCGATSRVFRLANWLERRGVTSSFARAVHELG